MEEATINFLHLCDAANIDSLGKISILGIFGKIFVPDLPNTPVKFTIVLSLTIKDIDPDIARNTLKIKIFGPDNEALWMQEPIFVDFADEHVVLEKGKEVPLFLDLTNVKFQQFGEHVLKVYFNGEEIGDHTFIVEEGNK